MLKRIDFVEFITAQANRVLPRPGDFKDPDTGLLICGRCHTPRECIIKRPGGQQITVGCACICDSQAWEEKRAKEKAARIECLRTKCIKYPVLRNMRFENSEDSDLLQKARSYVKDWKEVKTHNTGMVLWGPPGSGKTHVAACIANALIDKGIPAGIISIPDLMQLPFEECSKTIRQNISLPLLVVDDLGTERDTAYGHEVVYSIVNGRLNAGKPMVVTTNLGLKYMRESQATDYTHIYQRVLEACQPVKVAGKNYREDVKVKKHRILSDIFEGKK